MVRTPGGAPCIQQFLLELVKMLSDPGLKQWVLHRVAVICNPRNSHCMQATPEPDIPIFSKNNFWPPGNDMSAHNYLPNDLLNDYADRLLIIFVPHLLHFVDRSPRNPAEYLFQFVQQVRKTFCGAIQQQYNKTVGASAL